MFLLYFTFDLFQYLLSLKLNNSDILDVFQGLQFLPLDKITFLKVQCFMNLVEAMFTQIKYTAFLYNDQIVWYVCFCYFSIMICMYYDMYVL